MTPIQSCTFGVRCLKSGLLQHGILDLQKSNIKFPILHHMLLVSLVCKRVEFYFSNLAFGPSTCIEHEFGACWVSIPIVWNSKTFLQSI